jgi:hypothetical protein
MAADLDAFLTFSTLRVFQISDSTDVRAGFVCHFVLSFDLYH